MTVTERRIRLAAGLFVLAILAFVDPSGAQTQTQAQPQPQAAQPQVPLNIVVKDYPDYCRVTLSSAGPFPHRVEKNGTFLIVRVDSQQNFRIQREPFKSRWVKSFGWSKGTNGYSVTIELLRSELEFSYFTLNNPFQLLIDIRTATGTGSAAGEQAAPEKAGEDLARRTETAPPIPRPAGELGSRKVKTIVIDPGHGGMETGARGKFGTLEKDVTLSLALKLKAVIEKNLAFRVILSRDRDTDVSLDSRAALANNNKADLFISIHANGSYRRNAQGSETFFLSLNASDEESRKLAELENISEEYGNTIAGDNQDEIKMILWDMAQKGFIRQSSQLAEIVQGELNNLLGTANRGIKQAPFKVLTGVACPAILVEVAFISNPDEERKLGSEAFQDQVVQALYRGLLGFRKIFS